MPLLKKKKSHNSGVFKKKKKKKQSTVSTIPGPALHQVIKEGAGEVTLESSELGEKYSPPSARNAKEDPRESVASHRH